jgi:hypothetical protein
MRTRKHRLRERIVPILLINGPFGVGKSTAAGLVVERLPSAMLFDPEIIGSFLHRLVGPDVLSSDYQDLQLWRHLVVDVAHRLHADCGRDLIVPMCLCRYDYSREITDEFRASGRDVHCFRLTCSPETLRSRILGRRDEDGGHAWCLGHLASGLAAANNPRFGIEVDTEGRTPEEVAASIVAVAAAM